MSLSLALLLALGGSASGEEPVAEHLRIGGLELLEHPGIHSVSIGVYRGGEEFSAHFGELDPGEGNSPGDDTIYAVASITKTLTGFLAAKAVSEGKLGLDDDVRGFLTGSYPNLEWEGEPIRIRHLLTHSSHLPAELVGLEAFLQAGDIGGALEFVAEYDRADFFKDLATIQLPAKPGTGYLYSSNGTNLLAYILEEVYGKPYGELLQSVIFAEAGMDDTALELDAEQRGRLSAGYDGQGNQTPEQPRFLVGADGYLKSTTADLLRYMRFQLSEGNEVAKESRRQLNATGAPMGYFWQIEQQPELTFVKHAGTAFGTTTWLLVCPDEGLGVALVISSRFQGSNDLLYEAGVELMKHLMSED